MTARVDLYDSAYTNFARPVEATVRAETYGEDIGQSSWITAEEWASYFRMLGLGADSEVLEVGCGSGGPAAYLARTVGCRVVGVDVPHPRERDDPRLKRLAHEVREAILGPQN